MQLSVREALSSKKDESWKEAHSKFSETLADSDDDEANFDNRMRLQILKKRKELGDHSAKQKSHNGNIMHSFFIDIEVPVHFLIDYVINSLALQEFTIILFISCSTCL